MNLQIVEQEEFIVGTPNRPKSISLSQIYNIYGITKVDFVNRDMVSVPDIFIERTNGSKTEFKCWLNLIVFIFNISMVKQKNHLRFNKIRVLSHVYADSHRNDLFNQPKNAFDIYTHVKCRIYTLYCYFLQFHHLIPFQS